MPANLNPIRLADLHLVLQRWFGPDRALVELSATGRLYQPPLRQQLERLHALPDWVLGGLPFADAIGALDDDFDEFGRAVFWHTSAYLHAPRTPPELIEAARRVQAEYVPSLAGLKQPFADEADAATRRRKNLSAFEADLKRFPLAHGTLYDWVVDRIEAGEAIGRLLAERGTELAMRARTDASKLRTETIALIGRWRATLADEVANDPTLPRDLEGQLFAYLDELARQRAESIARRVKPEAEPKPTP